MRMGISTASFYPQSTERALERVARAGARCAEVFINAEQEFSPEFIELLSKKSNELGVEIVSLHPYTSGYETMSFYSDYPRRLEDGMEQYRRYFAAASSLGARFFVMHGAFLGSRLSDQAVFERFFKLAQVAKTQGITLLQENVSRCRSGAPEFISKMRVALGEWATFVLDIKQAVRSGCGVAAMQSAMGDGIRHIHISDHLPHSDCLPPGKGGFDIPGFLLQLRENGYDDDVVLELYRESYTNLEELTKSYEYLEDCAAVSRMVRQDSTALRPRRE